MSSSENSIRSSRVQLRPMGEMFSMPFRNSMKVPLVVMGWEGGQNQREGENGPEFNPALLDFTGDENPPTKGQAGASSGPLGETYPFSLRPRTEGGAGQGWVGSHRFLGSLSRAM